ncbi:MAG: putative quinol monooxygenase [Mycobacteriales bacterium]
MPLVVIATLPGKPDKRDELAEALSKAAAASRGDAGCVSYAFHRDLEDPDRYVSVEVWQDQASLDAHFQAPHLAELFAVMGDLLAGPPVIETYPTA